MRRGWPSSPFRPSALLPPCLSAFGSFSGSPTSGMWARRSVSRRMNGSYVDYTAIRVWAIRRGPLCHQSSAAFRAVQGATYFVEHPHDHLGPPATARAGPHADARRRLVPRRWRVGVSRSQAHMGASREPRRLHELFWTHRRVASEVGLGLLGRQKLLLRVASRLRAVRRVSKPTPSNLGQLACESEIPSTSQRFRVRVRSSGQSRVGFTRSCVGFTVGSMV